jgi:hypothetical protein
MHGRKGKAGVSESDLHSFTGFTDFGGQKTYHIEDRKPRGNIGFHLNQVAVNPLNTPGNNGTEHQNTPIESDQRGMEGDV